MAILTIRADAPGERADQLLARSVEGLTRSAAQKLLDEGRVTAGGKPLKKNARPDEGMLLTVDIPNPEPVDIVPQDIPLDVVYEDEDVIVVNKPVGLVVHPAPGHPDGTLVNALLYHCGDSLSGINGEKRPGHRPPHRPGHLRSHHRRQERRRPPGAGRPAGGPHPRPVPTSAWCREICGRTRAPSTPPSPAIPVTARRWRWSAAASGP